MLLRLVINIQNEIIVKKEVPDYLLLIAVYLALLSDYKY